MPDKYDLEDKMQLAQFLEKANIRLVPRIIGAKPLLVPPSEIRESPQLLPGMNGPPRCASSSCKNSTAKVVGSASSPLRLMLSFCSAPVIFSPLLPHCAGRRLPRRQEAEYAYAGSRTALVTHEEVRGWGGGRSEGWSFLPGLCFRLFAGEVLGWARGEQTEIGRIVSVSHVWEAREHPDPYGFQLQKLATSGKLRGQDCLFVDYVSLFQFKRLDETQEESFRRAMQNMHVLYAHEHTHTLRVESLTPEGRIKDAWCHGELVEVYDLRSGHVKPVLAADLIQNRTAYHQRGWCVAELQWSSTRSESNRSQEVDSSESDQAGVAPMDPDTFRATVGDTLIFTHRSDADAVMQLQRRVFEEKAASCKALKLSNLSADALAVGLTSLDRYPQLESLARQAVHD